MGGTGVASAHYLSAPLINPALLARFSHSDDIGLLLPAIGAEMDAWGWLQFRGGFRYDLEDNDSNQVTLGMGLSPFNIGHFDLTGMLSEDETYGLVAQTSFTF